MARLEFITGDHPPIVLGERTVVGRSRDHASAVIDDKRLSRKHSEIVYADGKYVIEDLASRNGTRVAGRPVKQTVLKDGDEISLGGLKLRFVGDDPEALELPEHVREATDPLGPLVRLEIAETEGDAAKAAETPEAAAPSLKLVKGTLPVVLVRLDTLPFTVGRKSDNDLVLEDDRQASGKHARFERDPDGRVALVDLNSTNGTKVNGKSISRITLEDGMRLQIGSQTFRFDAAQRGDDATEGEGNGSEPTFEAVGEDLDAALADLPDDLDEAAISKAGEEAIVHFERDMAQAIGSAPVGESGGRVRRLVIRALEIVVALGVAAAAAAFFALSSRQTEQVAATGAPAAKPVLSGGLLTLNPSFESGSGDTGPIKHWLSLFTAPSDSFTGEADPGIGGGQVLRAQRWGRSVERSLLVCLEKAAVTADRDYEVAAWVRAPSPGAAAFLFVEWFLSEEDAGPARRDYRAYAAASPEWARIVGHFTPPAGAALMRMGVGVTGGKGVLLFDQASVEEVEAKAAAAPASDSASPLDVSLDPAMTLRVSYAEDGRNAPQIVDVRMALLDRSGEGEGVLHHEWLVAAPTVERSADGTRWTFSVFDPEAVAARTLDVVFSGNELKARVEASPNSSLVGLRLAGLATDALMPDDLAVLASGRAIAYGRDVRVEQARRVVFVDTGGSRALSGDGVFSCKGRSLSVFRPDGEIALRFDFTPPNADFARFTAMCRGDAAAERSERALAALELARRFPYNRAALRAAAQAMQGVTTAYRLKQIEVRELLTAKGDLIRDGDIYLRAVETAGLWSTELTGLISLGAPMQAEIEGVRSSAALGAALREDLGVIDRTFGELAGIRAAFDDAVTQGRTSTLRLRLDRQEEDATPVFASAEDHWSSGELVQARLKYLSIIEYYPYSYQASLSRRRLLELAAGLVDEYEARRGEGLVNMASEANAKALELVNRVLETQAALEAERYFERIAVFDGLPAQHQAWKELEANLAQQARAMRTRLSRE